jgi:hypothetical protein
MTFIAAGVQNQIGIEKTGINVDVKDFFYVRLKYYLSCVGSFIDNIPYKYRNYKDFKSGEDIYISELKEMYELLKKCSPQQMENQLYFIEVEEGFAALKDLENDFFKITCQRDIVALILKVKEAAILASRSSGSMKIMFFQNSWAIKYYYHPINELKVIIGNYYGQYEMSSLVCLVM